LLSMALIEFPLSLRLIARFLYWYHLDFMYT
jgi:hypothetical protein